MNEMVTIPLDEVADLRRRLQNIEARDVERRLRARSYGYFLLLLTLVGFVSAALTLLGQAFHIPMTRVITIGIPVALIVLIAAALMIGVAVFFEMREADRTREIHRFGRELEERLADIQADRK